MNGERSSGAPLHLTRVLALLGVAGIAALAHSLVVPIKLGGDRPAATTVQQDGDSSETAANKPGGGGAPADADTDADPASPSATPRDGTEEGSEGAGEGYEIDLGQGAALHERATLGEPIWFLDARRPEDYAAGHVARAVQMDASRIVEESGTDVLYGMGVLPNDTIVVYCTGGDCHASHQTRLLLVDEFPNVLVMTAGFDEWAAAGLPVEEGAGP